MWEPGEQEPQLNHKLGYQVPLRSGSGEGQTAD